MKKGFTLIELLVVMGLMLVLATISLVSYHQFTSGLGMSIAVNHLRQTLMLARQTAIMHGKSVGMVFYQDASNSWYAVCTVEGTAMDKTSFNRVHDFNNAELGSLKTGMRVYNLSRAGAEFSTVVETSGLDPEEQPYVFDTADNMWSPYDRYGWEARTPLTLPRGFRFDESDMTTTFFFKSDGTIWNYDGSMLGSGKTIRMYEKIAPDKFALVHVARTGMVSVDFQ